MGKILRLTIFLEDWDENAWQTLDRGLSRYPGITAPGVDMPSGRLQMVYDPKVISKVDILDHVSELGYRFTEVIEG